MRTKYKHKWRRFRAAEWDEHKSRPRNVEQLLAEIVDGLPRRRRQFDIRLLDAPIEHMRHRAETALDHDKALYLKALLVLQAPRAAYAQNQMDEHEHGYHDRNKRLYELIDFNDTFVSAVLALPQEGLTHFTEHIKHQMLVFCEKLHAPMLSDEQFEAIVHGLSKEIAVYLAAKQEGLHAEMTSRSQDAFGIDMVISDPHTQLAANIDCKTESAFRHRVGELIREGRLDEADFDFYDQRSFATVINRQDGREIAVTIVAIDHQKLGQIVNFQFADTAAIGRLLREVLDTAGA